MPFLAPLAAVASIAGSAVGAVGAIEQGNAAKEQADYQAKIAERNSQIAGYNEAAALQAGEVKAGEHSLYGAGVLGAMKVSQAANNVDVNRGSAVDVRGSRRMALNLGSATDMYNAMREGWGYANQGRGLEYQAQADLAAGENAQKAGYFNAASSILGGIGNLPIGGATGFLGGASPTSSAIADNSVNSSSSNYDYVPSDRLYG